MSTATRPVRAAAWPRTLRRELFEIRDLAIGKPAPEITGEDVDGQPMKLSDFRGKVVCLVFWTSSCTPCREIVNYEQSLASSFRGAPFILLGVNLGDDRDLLKRQIKEAGITFPLVVGRSWQPQHFGADRLAVQHQCLPDPLHP